MSKYLKASLRAALALSALIVGGMAAGADEIKVGFIGPITGQIAELGQAMQKAAQLAVDEQNDAGGVEIGDKKYTLTLALGDTEGTMAERAVSAVQRLIQFDRVVGFVGNAISTNVLAQMPITQNIGVPYINSVGKAVSIPEKIAAEKMTYIFQLSPTNDDLVASHGAFLKKYFNLKRIAFIGWNTDAARDYAERANKQWANLFPGMVMDVQYVESGRMDMQPEILHIKSFAPDLLYVLFAGTHTYAFVDQFAAAGLNHKMIVLGDSEYAAPNFPDRTGEKTNLQFANAVTFEAPITPKTLPFYNHYREKYKMSPAYYAVQTYDAMLMMIEGLHRMPKYTGNLTADRTALRDALDTITKDKPVVATRGNAYFLPVSEGHKVFAQIAITQFQNGKSVLVWPEGSGASKPIPPVTK
jgi:branched-chain amino acid transport system substrate-binding protein